MEREPESPLVISPDMGLTWQRGWVWVGDILPELTCTTRFRATDSLDASSKRRIFCDNDRLGDLGYFRPNQAPFSPSPSSAGQRAVLVVHGPPLRPFTARSPWRRRALALLFQFATVQSEK